MNSSLTVTDPLAEEAVTIVITLPVGSENRGDRPVLVSLGVAENVPILKTGAFADIAGLIDEAWTSFGLQAAAAAAAKAADETDSTAAAEADAGDETVAEAPVAAPAPPAGPATPQPTAQNLSLF